MVDAGGCTRAKEECIPAGGAGKGLPADARAIIEWAREVCEGEGPEYGGEGE